MKMNFYKLTLLKCLLFFGSLGFMYQSKAQSTIKTVPYGLGKIVMDSNNQALPQHEFYLFIPAAHFVKPQYTGNIESDKYLFEGAVSTWIKQYPDEYKSYLNQLPLENPTDTK